MRRAAWFGVVLLAALAIPVHGDDLGSMQQLGGLTISVTTDPAPLPPSEATVIIHVTRFGEPAAGETLGVRLEGRRHVRFDMTTVTDNNGDARIDTYFNNAGDYTLTISNEAGSVMFPISVRGTTVLVIGLLAAGAALLALLFEKKLH